MPSPACDRCHSIKARCLTGPSGSCYRCYRLKHTCTYSRCRGKRGRKPRAAITEGSVTYSSDGLVGSLASPLPSSPNDSIEDSIKKLEEEDDEEPTQKLDLSNIIFQEGIISPVSECTSFQVCAFYSFGPRLSFEMSQLIQCRMEEAPSLLLHPYEAFARVLYRCITNQTPCSNEEWSKGASALKALRNAQINAQISKAEYVGGILALGTSAVGFHRLISGMSASAICRHTLTLIRPLYYADELRDFDMGELLCLVFMDTLQSLFRARIPVIEYRVRDPYLVNHYAGLCAPLLPLLYRVCIVGAAIRTGHGDNVSRGDFDCLTIELNAWSPNVSKDMLQRFSDDEMLLLLSQANLNRTAALLLLHRLQYPFGERDAEAELLSQSMVDELILCLHGAEQFPPNVTLAFLLAGAEVHDLEGRERILSLIFKIKGAYFFPFISNLRMFLARVWRARDRGTARYLFRFFEEDPELSVPL
jgi:hypothetical protein